MSPLHGKDATCGCHSSATQSGSEGPLPEEGGSHEVSPTVRGDVRIWSLTEDIAGLEQESDDTRLLEPENRTISFVSCLTTVTKRVTI